jgi:F420-non-reducing hydrogenase small subunit
MADNEKLKIAIYWNSSCGGCEVAIVGIDEAIFKVVEIADIYMWPVAMDFKEHHIQDMDENFLDLAFLNGAIRDTHQEHMAHLFREKSKLIVSFGACAVSGGIPGLANFYSIHEAMEYAYKEVYSNIEGNVLPQVETEVDEGVITIPRMYNRVKALHQVIDVDYYIPGCPPVADQIVDAVLTLATDPPEKGHVFAGEKALCDTCEREKSDKVIEHIKRHQFVPDKEIDNTKCFLEQGILCLGPVTRSGCGNRCINANMPCRGCFGYAPNVEDGGAKFLSAVASVMDIDEEDKLAEFVDEMVDPAGYFYRFTLPISILGGNIAKEKEE